MPHAIIQIIKGQPQAAAQTPGDRNEALGLLALCWLLAAGVFIAVKWAGAYTPPWTLVFFRLLFATLFLLPFVASHFREMAARLRDHYKVILLTGALGLALTQGALFTALHHSSVSSCTSITLWGSPSSQRVSYSSLSSSLATLKRPETSRNSTGQQKGGGFPATLPGMKCLWDSSDPLP